MNISKKVQMCLMSEGSEGLSLRLPSRWINTWCDFDVDADGNFVQVWHLHAGNEMLPADYKEKHETLESLLESMRSVRDLRSWQPSSYYQAY